MTANLNINCVDKPVGLTNFLKNVIRGSLLLGAIHILTACGNPTLPSNFFIANFNSDTVGGEPASQQQEGTILLDRGWGSIRVVDAPAEGLPTNKWARINHPKEVTPSTGIKCKFSKFIGGVKYRLLTNLYIEKGAGKVTMQFETDAGGAENFDSFYRVDFLPDGSLNVDGQKLGQYPRNQVFAFAISMYRYGPANPRIEIELFGANTAFPHPDDNVLLVDGPMVQKAANFGGVRFWMEAGEEGTFFLDDILISIEPFRV